MLFIIIFFQFHNNLFITINFEKIHKYNKIIVHSVYLCLLFFLSLLAFIIFFCYILYYEKIGTLIKLQRDHRIVVISYRNAIKQQTKTNSIEII